MSRSRIAILLLLVLPHVLTAPLLFSGTEIAAQLGYLGFYVNQRLAYDIAASILTALLGLVWLVALVPHRVTRNLIRLSGAILVIAWGFWTIAALRELAQSLAQANTAVVMGPLTNWMYVHVGLTGAPAALSAGLLVATTFHHRASVVALGALVPSITLTTAYIEATLMKHLWGVWWLWDVRHVAWLDFHATWWLATAALVFATWTYRPAEPG